MSLDEPTNDTTLVAVAALLGVPDTDALAKLRVEALRRRTQRELVEIARRLSLTGITKLNKEALATRIYQTLLARSKGGRPPTPITSARSKASARSSHSNSTSNSKAVKAVKAVPPSPPPSNANGADTEAHVPIKMTHKFEVGEQATAPAAEPRTIPWSYGQDRVTAMPQDPDRLYVYWELTDEAIARARPQLGGGGARAWLELRVYDVTGLIFDGTNAHSYFDHKVERHDRQWFFAIGKPTSQAIVEIGLKSHEGYFVKLARSGRVDFPAKEPHGWTSPEWMTVRPGSVQVEGGGGGGGGGAGGAGAGGELASVHGFEPVPLWQMRMPREGVVRFAQGGGQERIEWEEIWREGDGQFTGHRTFTWESPMMVSSWEAGPFTYPVEVPPPETESSEGPVRVQRVAGRTHVVYGPWQVVIRGLGAHYTREVVARWEVERSWVAEEGHEVRAVRTVAGVGGSSELLAAGASERRWRGASELRLMGASEVYYMGASERWMLGASETVFSGASEYRARGASERRFLGASEQRFLGASERRLGGASERAYGGGSEGRMGGGSEGRLAGAREPEHGTDDSSDGSSSPYPAPPASGSHG